jgi:glycosyltransferase involved in cell wall biosynthesis
VGISSAHVSAASTPRLPSGLSLREAVENAGRAPNRAFSCYGDARVRVALDLTLVRPDRLTGVERYATCLAAALARLAPGEIVVFRRPDAPAAISSLPVEQVAAPFRARVPVDQAWLPAAALRARVELLHTLAFPTPLLWRGAAAMTVHDATPWLHPDTVSAGMRLYYRPLYRQALRRARVVFTVSEASRRDLGAAAEIPLERIRVTPNGVDPVFFSSAAPPAGARPYVLAVGTLEPRKNLPVLLEAFRRLRADGRDLELRLVGRQGWAERLRLDDAIAPDVRLTGAVGDEELASLYAGAACFVLPSRYEGFGLPLAEAMASGTPAVASDIPALRELGADDVLYAPPGEPAALAAAVAGALDAGRAPERLARARARMRGYSWERCAEVTLSR